MQILLDINLRSRGVVTEQHLQWHMVYCTVLGVVLYYVVGNAQVGLFLLLK